MTFALAPHVDVGLAVGDDQDLVALQLLAQDAPQRLRRPHGVRIVARAAIGLEIAHQRLEVRLDRAQLGHAAAAVLARRAGAGEQRLEARHPAAPGQLGDDHRDERHHRGDRREQVHDVHARFVAAPFDEAHVVHHQQRAEAVLPGADRPRLDMQRALGKRQHVVVGERRRPRAVHLARKAARGVGQPAVTRAQADGKHALFAHRTLEQADHGSARRRAQQLDQPVVQPARDDRAAVIEIAHEPLQRQAIDERHDRVGNRRKRNAEGQDEAQG